MGPIPPTRFRKQRCSAEPVEPRLGGEMSRIMMAAGARHISLSANPTSSAPNDCVEVGARMLPTSTGDAAIVAPAQSALLAGEWIYSLSFCPQLKAQHRRRRLFNSGTHERHVFQFQRRCLLR